VHRRALALTAAPEQIPQQCLSFGGAFYVAGRGQRQPGRLELLGTLSRPLRGGTAGGEKQTRPVDVVGGQRSSASR
jgi:hypothetical protein